MFKFEIVSNQHYQLFLKVPNGSIFEGENINFVLQANPVPLTPIQVNLNIQEEFETGHLVGLLTEDPVIIGTNGIYEGIISTNDLSEIVGHGSIRISIEDGIDYNISPSERDFSIAVLDREISNKPEVFVVSSQSSIVDGDTVEFTFSAVPIPEDEIRVNILVVQQNSVIQWKVPRSITLRDFKTISVMIRREDDAEIAGEVSVMVLAGEDYLANERVARVAVQEREDPPILEPEARNSVANSVAQQLLSMLEDTTDEPIVSIFPMLESVTEGTSVQFQISSTKDLTNDINLSVTQTGDFLSSVPPTQISFVGQREFLLNLETVVNDAEVEDGSISVSLIDGEGYRVSESNSSASVILVNIAPVTSSTEQISTGLQAVLPTIFQTSNTVFAKNTSERMDAEFNSTSSSNFQIGGNLQSIDVIQNVGEGLNQNNLELRSLLDNSSFLIGSASESKTNRFSIWGFSDYQDINSDSSLGEDLLKW